MTTAPSSPIAPERATFEQDGFYLSTTPLVPPDLVARVSQRMDAVIRGEYATGVPPIGRSLPIGETPTRLVKIDDSHLSDPTIHELINYPAIGQMAAKLMGAKWVQAWASQLLFKPPGSEAAGNVGWHQDKQYWNYWEGEVFTVWIAISDVTLDSGPVAFVPGSHRWGELSGGDFFGTDRAAQRRKVAVPEGKAWVEVPGILPPGGVSFHHRLTFHGSGPNHSHSPRRAFAFHLRTEKSNPVPGATDYFVSRLDDPKRCPVIFGG